MYHSSITYSLNPLLCWSNSLPRADLKLRKVFKVSIFIQFLSKNSNGNIRIQLSHSTSACQCPDNITVLNSQEVIAIPASLMYKHQQWYYLLSLCLHFNGHFPCGPGLAQLGWYQNVSILDFIGAKDDGDGGNNWSYKMCKSPVKMSPPTNQHPVFFTGRMPFLSPNWWDFFLPARFPSCYTKPTKWLYSHQ